MCFMKHQLKRYFLKEIILFVCYLCVCVCGWEGVPSQLENSVYYIPFLKIHNTNQQIEDPNKVYSIAGD